MKKVMFALCFVFGGMMSVRAQDTTSSQYKTEQQSQYPQDQQDRQRIQTSELPDAVKRSLEDQEYRGWLVSGAFKASAGRSMQPDSTGVNGQNQENQGNNNVIGAEGEEIYIVELKNGAETRTVAFRKDGQRIEGWHDQNDQYNQIDQSNQYNQNDQMNESDSANQNNQSGQQNRTPELQSTTPDQSGQSTSGEANKDTQH